MKFVIRPLALAAGYDVSGWARHHHPDTIVARNVIELLYETTADRTIWDCVGIGRTA
jgi:hypothetical protein